MFWLQAIATFAVWVGLGVWLARRSPWLRRCAASASRAKRTIGGAAMMIFGAAAMFGGLAIIDQRGGYLPSGMEPWAWALTTVLGAAFVAAQTVATAVVVTLLDGSGSGETAARATASGKRES